MSANEPRIGGTSPIEASKILTDPYAARILAATSRRAKSPQQLSEECGIPIAACYRRIKSLESVGFIKCSERPLTREGKRIRLYSCQIFNARIFFEEGKFKVNFQFVDGRKYKYGGDPK